MKVIRKHKPEGFRPITLEITFETVSELKTLWNQLNVTAEEVSERSQGDENPMEVVEVSDLDRLFTDIHIELSSL
tara:strand:+ start:381 stop:605 length:225 start_codon:yes stop_codon:yes gene_type:complete